MQLKPKLAHPTLAGQPNRHFFSVALLAGSLLLSGLLGCREPEGIRVYTVAKEDSGKRAAPSGPSSSAGQEQKMLAAVVPRGNAAWFFKLTGEPSKVDLQAEAFRQAVDSVTFPDSGAPSWQLPEGWTDQMSTGMTYAKWSHAETGLQATVTTLLTTAAHASPEGWQDYIVINVNRWRKQLALADQTWPEMQSELQEIPELKGDEHQRPAYYVSLLGTGSGAMRGPFMSQFTNGSAPAQPPSTPPAGDAKSTTDDAASPGGVAGYRFTEPEGWEEEKPSSSFRQMQFSVNRQGETADVEIIVSQAGGALGDNMQMWFGQVAADKSEEAIQNTIDAGEKLVVNEIESAIYEINGPDGKSITLAEIPSESGQSRYIKMIGETEAVKAQRDNLVAFLKSLSW